MLGLPLNNQIVDVLAVIYLHRTGHLVRKHMNVSFVQEQKLIDDPKPKMT